VGSEHDRVRRVDDRGFRWEAEQIVGDMLARARKADQEALLLQVAYSSLQAYQALRGA